MSAIPKSAGFSFKTETHPFPFQQPQPAQTPQMVDINQLPADLQKAIADAKAIGVNPQPQPQGWSPNKAPTIDYKSNADGTSNVGIAWPPQQPSAAPPPAAANMPPWVANQFGQQQQQVQQPAPAQVQQVPIPAAVPPSTSGRPRVMVLICSPTLVDTRFAAMMMRLPTLAATAGCEWGWITDWRYGLAETRMQLIIHAMNVPGVTHVLFLDADMIINADDALAYMLQDNLPIVSGVYWNSLGSGIAAWVGGKTIGLQQPAAVVPVEQVGMGCCLIKTEVFQALKQQGAPWPWFHYHINPDKPREFYGEDFFFQQLCSDPRIGVVPYVDFRVKCRHIKPTVYEFDGQMHMQEYG